MRTTRRLATLALAATAGLGLAACSATVHATATPAPKPSAAVPSDSMPSDTMEEAADTGSPETTAPETGSTGSTDGTSDLPVPGEGVTGDEGLCQAVAGWYGYVGLSAFAANEDGTVDPATVVPLLQELRDAPKAHQDASGPVRAAAADVSSATDGVIDEVQAGTDLISALQELDGPITAFGDACTAAGVSV
jgi:hypothetical protein